MNYGEACRIVEEFRASLGPGEGDFFAGTVHSVGSREVEGECRQIIYNAVSPRTIEVKLWGKTHEERMVSYAVQIMDWRVAG